MGTRVSVWPEKFRNDLILRMLTKPAVPFKWPTPKAMQPPKAPAAVADARTIAMRSDRSSTGYHIVTRKMIPGKNPASNAYTV